MAVTEADRILAAGVPLRFADGEEVRVRFDLRAVAQLETEFGSIAAAADAIDSRSPDQPMVEPLRRLLTAGLLHCGGVDGALDRLDISAGIPAALAEAWRAVLAAWVEAFPPPPLQETSNGHAAVANGSPGASTTGSPPPSAAAPQTSSGG